MDLYTPKNLKREKHAKKKAPLKKGACVGKRPLKNQGTFPWGCPHFWGDLSARSARSRPRIKICTVRGAKIISTSPLVAYILSNIGTRSNIMGYNIYFVLLRRFVEMDKYKKPLILRGFLRVHSRTVRGRKISTFQSAHPRKVRYDKLYHFSAHQSGICAIIF